MIASGGAPLPPDTHDFIRMTLGVPVLQGNISARQFLIYISFSNKVFLIENKVPQKKKKNIYIYIYIYIEGCGQYSAFIPLQFSFMLKT